MDVVAAMTPLELWGGIECTVNRVGDAYFSQLDGRPYNGGISDLARFAELGIRTLRYPVLWERVDAQGDGRLDWTWSDAHLGALRRLAVRPIVGLVHHGSGPRHTSLVDPDFPARLARYAGQVANRYPWITDYTPVNEPLTTARFSGLYGLWYPHGRDVVTFRKALFNQCRGIVLSMREIRRVTPGARLVQTDDLGTTHATPALEYQAAFNNQLRWLGWDLLCGKVDRGHPLWHWLRECCEATADEIDWFAGHPCPPDLIGINHYVTSDRYLDDRLANHPPGSYGGNDRDRYADVEAARAIAAPVGDIASLLKQAWQRYGLPMAVTEAHIDATREDQMRWLSGLWQGAQEAKRAGADVRALTIWSLLGSYDWNSLLTGRHGYYEAGAFDVRSGEPRATALTGLIRSFARGEHATHPAIPGRGWWQRPERLGHGVAALAPHCQESASPQHDARRPILIVGADSTLGRSFAQICAERDLHHGVLTLSQFDMADADAVRAALRHVKPWAVIHAAGYGEGDEEEQDQERHSRGAMAGAEMLAGLCASEGIAIMTFSNDRDFDGQGAPPSCRYDLVPALKAYGRSKARLEAVLLDRYPETLIVRTGELFSRSDRETFLASALRALREGRSFDAANDRTVSPTYVPDLVHACLDLLIDRETGVWHLTNGDAVTWEEFVVRAATIADVDHTRLHAYTSDDGRWPVMQPRDSALVGQRSFSMPGLDDALSRYLAVA